MSKMLQVSEEQKKNVFNCLKEINLCNRCILRYMGYSIFEHGREPFLKPESLLSGLFHDESIDYGSESKKIKINPCRSCLNILNEATIEDYAATIPNHFNTYEFQDYYITLTFPNSMSIRDIGTFLYLKEKFPELYKDFQVIEKIKKVFRTISSYVFSLKLNRHFKDTSNFRIDVNIVYEDDEKETKNLHKITSNKAQSKRAVSESLHQYSSGEDFKNHFPIPPNLQDKDTYAKITFSTSAVYLGGRYLKFSRDMGQTPFVVNNISVTENSVQDVIFDSIVKVLNFNNEKLTFSASGREDADTRMVGNGRPFYIQMDDPKFEKITPQQCQHIEETIAQSNTVVVIKLQQVNQNSIKKIKFGEQEKKKHYHALCKSLLPNLSDAINKINLLRSVSIEQTTPIRVLHRRTHLIRRRNIFELNATPVQGYSDLFYLKLVTEAGTYVKEFVNGDYCRTNPNLSSITGYPVDVVALDVTDVDLEWPSDK